MGSYNDIVMNTRLKKHLKASTDPQLINKKPEAALQISCNSNVIDKYDPLCRIKESAIVRYDQKKIDLLTPNCVSLSAVCLLQNKPILLIL